MGPLARLLLGHHATSGECRRAPPGPGRQIPLRTQSQSVGGSDPGGRRSPTSSLSVDGPTVLCLRGCDRRWTVRVLPTRICPPGAAADRNGSAPPETDPGLGAAARHRVVAARRRELGRADCGRRRPPTQARCQDHHALAWRLDPPARLARRPRQTLRSTRTVRGPSKPTARTLCVQPAVRSGVASQPSRADIARAQLMMARTWSVVSFARHRIDQG